MSGMKLFFIFHYLFDIRLDRGELKTHVRFGIQSIAVFCFGSDIGRKPSFAQVRSGEREKNIQSLRGKKCIFVSDPAPKIIQRHCLEQLLHTGVCRLMTFLKMIHISRLTYFRAFACRVEKDFEPMNSF